MTSAINIHTIDASYPVAGQDNDSQGFRDNFEHIKTALQTAADEITVLQDNSIQKGTDVDGIPQTNDLHGAAIANVQLLNSYGTAYVAPIPELPVDPIVISYQSGSFQSVSISRDSQMQVTDWPVNVPNNVYAVIRVEVNAITQCALTLVNPFGSIMSASNSSLVLVMEESDRVVLDIWTTNGGSTVTVLEVANTRQQNSTTKSSDLISRFLALSIS